MSKVLRIWEEGQSALFLIADAHAETGRCFGARETAEGWMLEVETLTGQRLASLLLNREEWATLRLHRAHWLECQGQDLVLDLTIELKEIGA